MYCVILKPLVYVWPDVGTLLSEKYHDHSEYYPQLEEKNLWSIQE